MSTKVAAILVGGKGTRLRSVISDVPKPLAPVAGEPFLFLLTRKLVQAGIKRIVLLTGYMHEKIVDACGDGSAFGVEIIYSREFEPLGTGGALQHAQSILQTCPDFILMNGDTYFDCALDQFIHQRLNSMGCIALGKPDDIKRFGSVKINLHTQQIENFHEKSESGMGYVNAGIYKLSSHIFDYLPKSTQCSLETDIFPVLAKQSQLNGMLLSGSFYDIGLPESYADFNQRMQMC